MKLKVTSTLLAVIASATPALAQNTPADATPIPKKNEVKAKNTRQVRILAVGDTPISRMVMEKQSIKGMIGHEAEIDSKLLPPKVLYIHQNKKKPANGYRAVDKPKKSTEKIHLSLGMLSPKIDVKTKGSSIKLSAAESITAEDKPYSTVTLPQGSIENLVILYKQISNKNWDKPKTIVLSNDVAKFPAQTVRVINASSLTVAATFENKSFKLKPGQFKNVTLPVGKSVRFKGIVKNKNKNVKISNTGILLEKNQRMDLVFHNRISDRKKPIRVVKFPSIITPKTVAGSR